MTRHRQSSRKGVPLHGWLVIDKPEGPTSTDIVNQLKRSFRPQKIGHGGTLDPLASGILPIAFGEATKTIPHIMDARKIYRFTLAWGEERETDDREGAVTHRAAKRPEMAEIKGILPQFIGEIDQVPPRFSALKLSGKRAYDLARKGEAFELAPRKVKINALALLEGNSGENLAEFEMSCGKGTYVRAIARDLGRALGTRAHIVALRRLAVGKFTLDQARKPEDVISLDNEMELGHSARPEDLLLPVASALDDIPALAVMEAEGNRLRHGQTIRVPQSLEGVVRVMAEDELVALGNIHKGVVKPVRVFNG